MLKDIDTTNPDWWMNAHCKMHREWMFLNREQCEKTLDLCKRTGTILPEGWGKRFLKNENESDDWWLDEYCTDFRTYAEQLRDNPDTLYDEVTFKEALDQFMKTWEPQPAKDSTI